MGSLWNSVAGSSGSSTGALHARGHSGRIAELGHASCLGGRLESFRGRSVLLAMREQLGSALALLELDGVASRLVLCRPDLGPGVLADVAARASTEMRLDDLDPRPAPGPLERRGDLQTEWILLTSGTTGAPKLVVHTLSSLGGSLPRQAPVQNT